MARIVAELGRPETPGETAARKAEASRIYRGSQTMRNLIAALIATFAIVLVIVFMVPRGEVAPPPAIDVAETAQLLERDLQHPIVVPDVDESWRVNKAALDGGSPATWTITYAPGDGLGFLRVAQGINADAGWVQRLLPTGTPGDTVDLAGVSWQTYAFRDPAKAGNVSYALAAQAGTDHIVVFGSSPQDLMKKTAEGLAPQLTLLEEAP